MSEGSGCLRNTVDVGKEKMCHIKTFIGHNSKLPPKGDRGVSFVQAKALYQELGIVIAIGTRKYM